jgi:hypothetical protein
MGEPPTDNRPAVEVLKDALKLTMVAGMIVLFFSKVDSRSHEDVVDDGSCQR